MGSMIEPLICPSLARGIRRAYFEVLDANWADFGRRMKAFRQRTGGIDISSPKGFRREVERFRIKLMPQFFRPPISAWQAAERGPG